MAIPGRVLYLHELILLSFCVQPGPRPGLADGKIPRDCLRLWLAML